MSEPVEWSEAPNSVIHTAENLIKNFYPWLESARIAFVFRSKAQKLGDRFILGQCTKVPAKFQPYLEYDYIIWLSETDYSDMDDLRREALIDHELMHCKYGKNGWTIRPHDIQEFSDVIERHGVWSPDVRRAKRAIDAYETQRLPGMLVDTMTTLGHAGKVVTMTGAELERAAKALEGNS